MKPRHIGVHALGAANARWQWHTMRMLDVDKGGSSVRTDS